MSKVTEQQRPIQEAAGKVMRKFFFGQLTKPHIAKYISTRCDHVNALQRLNEVEFISLKKLANDAGAVKALSKITSVDYVTAKNMPFTILKDYLQKQPQNPTLQQKITTEASYSPAHFFAHSGATCHDPKHTELKKKWEKRHKACISSDDPVRRETQRDQLFKLLGSDSAYLQPNENRAHLKSPFEFTQDTFSEKLVTMVFQANLSANSRDHNAGPQFTTDFEPNSDDVSQKIRTLRCTHHQYHYGGDKTIGNGDCFFISLLEDEESFLAVMAAVRNAGMSGEDQGKLLAAHNVYCQLNNTSEMTPKEIDTALAPQVAAADCDSDIPPDMDNNAAEEQHDQCSRPRANAMVDDSQIDHKSRPCGRPTQVRNRASHGGESKRDLEAEIRRINSERLKQICTEFATLAQQNEAVETPQHRERSDSEASDISSASSTSIIVEHYVTPARSPRSVHNLLSGAPSASQSTSARIELDPAECSDREQTGEAKIIIFTKQTDTGKKRPTKVSAPEKLITAETAKAMIDYLVAKGVKTVTISDKYSSSAQEHLRNAVNANPAIKLEDQSSTNQTPQLSQ